MREGMDIVFLGLSITSSWGNGHATTYRGLLRALAERGHRLLFLERDLSWYAAHRDLPDPGFCQVEVYPDLPALRARHAASIREADLVVVGSYVPEGIEVGRWVQRTARGVTAFYDIDTPVTLARLGNDTCEYLSPELVPGYGLYFSFTGGPTLQVIEQRYRARAARALYCSVDPDLYSPRRGPRKIDLGYLGTYSADRQPALDRLMLAPARRWPGGKFSVAGPQYPETVRWPANVSRVDHLPPPEHARFYASQRFTLNITRADMVRAGWSPSVRLFEAAACAVPVVSDVWPGLEEIFVPGQEILLARSSADVLSLVRELPETERVQVGRRARARVLAEHTPTHRAITLEQCVAEVTGTTRGSRGEPARKASAAS
jgi:spore maturation protein CgeB